MKKSAYLLTACFIMFFSCNTTDTEYDGKNDSLSTDEIPKSEDQSFNEFLALFDDFAISEKEIIYIPPQDYYIDEEQMFKRRIPSRFNKYIGVGTRKFELLEKEFYYFDDVFNDKKPFHAIFKFRLFENIQSVIIRNELDKKSSKQTECLYYFMINYSNEGEIISIQLLSYLYIDLINNIKLNNFAQIISADDIHLIERATHMKLAWQKEYLSQYSLLKTGEIFRYGEVKNILETFSKEWTIITHNESGEKYIQKYCVDSPITINISKRDSEYYLRFLWGQDSDTYEIVSFESDPFNISAFKMTVINTSDQKEKKELTFRYNSPDKMIGQWKGFWEDRFFDFASKEYIESGKIKIVEPDCDDFQ